MPAELEHSRTDEPRSGDSANDLVPLVEGAALTDRLLIAYALPGEYHPRLVPAPAGRDWMRETHKQFAHRCLPLLMANQAGWLILNEQAFEVTWNGGVGRDALRIQYVGGEAPRAPVVSVFGYGILTWNVGYLFRTPPGYNLAVHGPVNTPKDGICALAGLVETDWAVATFTMNWKLTRPEHPVRFEAGEPFCMVAPQRRHELEEFTPGVVPLEAEPELLAQWEEWSRRRELVRGLITLTHRMKGTAGSDAVPYERHYFNGTSPGGWSAPEHQRKLELKQFEARSATVPPSPGRPVDA